MRKLSRREALALFDEATKRQAARDQARSEAAAPVAVTLTLDANVLEAARAYASACEITLDVLIQNLLASTVAGEGSRDVEEMFRLMDENPGNSQGRGWTREELYERR